MEQAGPGDGNGRSEPGHEPTPFRGWTRGGKTHMEHTAENQGAQKVPVRDAKFGSAQVVHPAQFHLLAKTVR